MTLLLPTAAASLFPAVPRPVLPGAVVSTQHFWEKISQQGDRERNTHQRRGGYLGNDRFNAVSHKHALIRAERWYNRCGIQIRTERGGDGETGGAMIHTLCSGQVVSSPKSSVEVLTSERGTNTTSSISSIVINTHQIILEGNETFQWSLPCKQLSSTGIDPILSHTAMLYIQSHILNDVKNIKGAFPPKMEFVLTLMPKESRVKFRNPQNISKAF